MRTLRLWLGLLGVLALVGVPASTGAQPVGSEFQVNTYTTLAQRTSSGGNVVAADASGNFVVVWQSLGQDGSATGIFGQRFDNTGQKVGSEFRVNSHTTNFQTSPSVASAADGDFVVVWESNLQDGSEEGIFGQRYDGAGQALGEEFRVNSYTPDRQSDPSVAANANGDFVVVWVSLAQDGYAHGVFGQRYDSDGETLGSEFRVNTYTMGPQGSPSVSSDASGNFVVVWNTDSYYFFRFGIVGKRYDSEGVPQGDEFRVNSYTTRNVSLPSVASDASGNFVVAWESFGQDGYGDGIFGQRFDSAGKALGGEFQVNSYVFYSQKLASVASDADGDFVVAWSSFSQDGSRYGIFGQRYDSAGVAQGDELQMNSYTANHQSYPSVAALGADQFVVVWESKGQDGSNYGVFGRRLGRER